MRLQLLDELRGNLSYNDEAEPTQVTIEVVLGEGHDFLYEKIDRFK